MHVRRGENSQGKWEENRLSCLTQGITRYCPLDGEKDSPPTSTPLQPCTRTISSALHSTCKPLDRSIPSPRAPPAGQTSIPCPPFQVSALLVSQSQLLSPLHFFSLSIIHSISSTPLKSPTSHTHTHSLSLSPSPCNDTLTLTQLHACPRARTSGTWHLATKKEKKKKKPQEPSAIGPRTN
ncbi:hypothetical protein BKA81DRAFT_115749 [Phyllosticta paracitricarpa]